MSHEESDAQRRLGDEGGPAFPSHEWLGMTVRDYFAARAMVALLNRPEIAAEAARQMGASPAEFVARAAYEQSDAMLAERTRVRP